MKNVIFAIITSIIALFAPVCSAETSFEYSFEFISNVDITPCQTINRFYKERCEAVADNSESVERMIEFETRQIQYEIKNKLGRDF